MSSPKAVCLLSGGLDSSTCLGVARRDGYECYALSFDYGQRHRVELDAAARVAKFFETREHRVARIDLRAFGARCTHLGCLVERTAQGLFACPCHNSRFTADGHIDRSSGGVVPSPRDMDSLEVKIETIDGTEMVLVKFQNFITARADKIPIA